MKRLAMLFVAGLAGCAQERDLDHPSAWNDAARLGTWEAQHSIGAGISMQMPCKALDSSSDGQDGYGHADKYYELRCTKELAGNGIAFFRVSRTAFPLDRDLARQNFQKYMDLVRSGSKNEPTVQLAGQQQELHVDYVLQQRSVRGDLGFHSLADSCMWNFMGLDGNSEVQAIMTLPRSMCPAGNQPISTGIASRFFDSILYDAW